MNLEIRRSFVKDVEKLPASTKVMIEKVIQDIISKNKLSELSSCKKLSGFKTAYRIRLGKSALVSFMKRTLLNLYVFWIEKIFTSIFHKII